MPGAGIFVPLGGQHVTALGQENAAKYVFSAPNGARAVLNDEADPDHVGFIMGDDGVSGLLRGAVRSARESLPEGDGSVAGAYFYEGLGFMLKGQLDQDLADLLGDPPAASLQSRLMAATDCMRSVGTLTWYPTTIPGGVFLLYRQEQATVIGGKRPKTFLVTGTSESSTVMSVTLHELATSIADPLAAVSPFNAGISMAYPDWVIEGPRFAPSIVNDTLDEAMVFTGSIPVNKRLIVRSDPNDPGITWEDGDPSAEDLLDYASSTYPRLASGANDVRFTGAGGGRGHVYWRDTWG